MNRNLATGNLLMPVHDWTHVDDETFLAFQTAWLTHLAAALNRGVLPTAYYAIAEQHPSPVIGDVLKLRPSSPSCPTRRTLSVRHMTGHRLVALVEIVSPGVKARPAQVQELLNKAESALRNGIHLLLVDLFPPGSNDPSGLHGALWRRFADETWTPPGDQPLTLASYMAGNPPRVQVEHLAVGASLKATPLSLTTNRCVSLPMEETYLAAFQGMPGYWRRCVTS